jgi:hypothetical protein
MDMAAYDNNHGCIFFDNAAGLFHSAYEKGFEANIFL